MESRIRTTGHAATVAVGVKNVQRIFRQCVLSLSVLLEDLIIVATQKMCVLTITKAYEHAVSLASFECSSRPLDFYNLGCIFIHEYYECLNLFLQKTALHRILTIMMEVLPPNVKIQSWLVR